MVLYFTAEGYSSLYGVGFVIGDVVAYEEEGAHSTMLLELVKHQRGGRGRAVIKGESNHLSVLGGVLVLTLGEGLFLLFCLLL